VGQAGATSSGGSSTATLKSRIGGNHLNGNVGSSTFRKTLAVILFESLSLDKTGQNELSTESEQRLSAWMRRHLAVGVYAVPNRAAIGGLEEHIVSRLDPPLNLQYCSPSAIRTRLKEFRKGLSAPLAPLGAMTMTTMPNATAREFHNLE
jgi:hypothetical protein